MARQPIIPRRIRVILVARVHPPQEAATTIITLQLIRIPRAMEPELATLPTIHLRTAQTAAATVTAAITTIMEIQILLQTTLMVRTHQIPPTPARTTMEPIIPTIQVEEATPPTIIQPQIPTTERTPTVR